MKTAMTLSLAFSLGLAGCAGLGGALVLTEPACQDVSVPIYFEPNQAGLTREGRRVISRAAADTRGCAVEAVRVLGLADAAGEPAANLELSKRRTATVSAALIQAKLPPADFDLTSAGDDGAVSKDGNVQPLRRRADIVVKLAKPK